MCLAIPMKIREIREDIANCEAAGVFRDVNLHLIDGQQPQEGDYVLVHLGYAIQKVPAPDAQASRETYDAMQAKQITAISNEGANSGGSHA
ncbi:HypC/HybG/HupF family hydrogenase formation chaperone [Teredinibacter haidensis]|uniref:HypC/HybG/HupF family hydrogenase formation chaperone n=1 Tax=Teredinibacter haidensis TaxID=2731755 RepID=UPI0009489EBD|nr:HypC/HybG/HupF family hydrogenase formation chaperone [Teredinibacter haidensis]